MTPLEQGRASIDVWQARLTACGLSHRAPPPEPSTCCGRGCNGCVWEGYYSALSHWQDDANALLDAQR